MAEFTGCWQKILAWRHITDLQSMFKLNFNEQMLTDNLPDKALPYPWYTAKCMHFDIVLQDDLHNFSHIMPNALSNGTGSSMFIKYSVHIGIAQFATFHKCISPCRQLVCLTSPLLKCVMHKCAVNILQNFNQDRTFP